ncbi:unnamed protein product [Penicillium nalgiovense]|uniref:CHY-type domain-containing protein n=1 Tax=Penicillium nalgiovense TaxID=60175 RepID=A0A9W4MT10_PENNA|nr:unnamed protein product [Penicillium nalgiovense]CAG7991201.1 unnamed protein product [Penicillium nalgiovense]CAG7991260.1 unnamed protein product [Penicillium nalgiovense]CAG7992548.1 unnamed protein product [Penicillium nalgiovense]CAG8001704.1 unnamed protein product [Penicillium nalgiovense]
MCKHILNAQVAIRSHCCRKWFDCAECHQESESHMLQKSAEMIFACKKCKKCFRKDAAEFDETYARNGLKAKRQRADFAFSDEYCPHCDNHFVIDAIEPEARLHVEGEDARIDNRMLKDERVARDKERSLFNFRDVSDRMG